MKSWFIHNFLITPYFDREFSKAEFVEGAKAAIVFVSDCLANNRLDDLQGSVDPDCLRTLRIRMAKMSMSQRAAFQVGLEDFVAFFIYETGIIMQDVPQQSEGEHV